MSIAVDNNTKPGYYDSVNGKVHTGERMKLAINLGWVDNWNTAKPFLNMVKGSGVGQYDGQWKDNTVASVSYWVSNSSCPIFPEATYVLTWDGLGECDYNINGSPIAETAESAAQGPGFYPNINRKEYQTTSGTGWTTSGPRALAGAQVTNIAFYDKAYETEFLAGKHIHPDFLQDISINDIIRVKDWMRGDDCKWTTYGAYPTTSWAAWTKGVPVEVLCELANETGGELFACIPHKLDSANRQLMATAFYNGLTTKKINIEWGNETWNSVVPWADQFWWAKLIDETKKTAIYTGSDGLFNEVTHGLSVGDLIRTFTSDTEPSSGDINWPWILGGGMRVTEVPDADHFKLSNWGNSGNQADETGTNTGASSQATTLDDLTKTWIGDEWVGATVYNEDDLSGTVVASGVVTGNTANQLTFSAGLSGGTNNVFNNGDSYSLLETDIPHPTFLTLFYCADPISGGAPSGTNSAEQTALCWDDFDTVFGRANVGHMAGTWMRGEVYLAQQLDVPQWRAGLDLITAAMYYAWYPFPDPITVESLTDEEIKALSITAIDNALYDDYIGKQLATTNHTRYAFYEGGQIYTDSIRVVGDDAASDANKVRMAAFLQTTQHEDLVRLWAQRNLAEYGAAWMCWFYSHSANTLPYLGPGTRISIQGVQSNRGLRTELSYTLWAGWKTAGGVPKP